MHDVTSISNRRQIGSYYELLLAWTARTVRARYQQSLLGILWAVAQPSAMVLVFSVIFTRFIPVDTGGPPYVLFSFSVLVPWTFFSTSLSDMVTSLVDNMNLVTKIYFPRTVVPIAALCARLLDFAISATLVAALMFYFRAPFFPVGWLFIPVILSVQLALTLGLGLAGAALNVFSRDVKHIVDLGLRVLIYASPVIYPVTVLPEHLRPLYFLNPMAGILTAYRDVLLYARLPGEYLLVSAAMSLLALVSGYWFFRRVEFRFADVV